MAPDHLRRRGDLLDFSIFPQSYHVYVSLSFHLPASLLTRKAAAKAEKAPRKAKKDPKAPKRALSAYMFFSQDWRERIKTENPDAGFGEVGKLLGAKWKELDEEEKKPYVDLAAKDKTRAEDEKAAYDSGKKSSADEADGDDDDD
ncbi:high mobility group box domain-containing protein [Mucidula mucida]|nr:high mobility group box domain-containing protein [Mucidula mucida]